MVVVGQDEEFQVPTRAYYINIIRSHTMILRHTHARGRARAKTNSCHATWPPPQAPGFSTPLELEPVRNNVTTHYYPRRTGSAAAAAAAFLSCGLPRSWRDYMPHRTTQPPRDTHCEHTVVVIKSNNNNKTRIVLVAFQKLLLQTEIHRDGGDEWFVFKNRRANGSPTPRRRPPTI